VSGWQLYLTGIVFLIPVCVGYYVIGVYLAKIHIRRWILVVLTVLGFVLTTIATYFADGYSSDVVFFFQGPGSPPMMLATLALFILLNSYAKPKTRSQMEKPSWIHRIMHVISENTLPIYLMHMVVVYLLKSGLFGFVLDSYAIDAIIGVPLIAVLTLMISLIIIIPLKKIPGIRKLIG
jgi:surface polysaccharide O-acyltransferase-like enzyme